MKHIPYKKLEPRYPAPALARGLDVLSTLASCDKITLEALASRTSIPKASLLRLLQTLETKKLVCRDDNTRTYAALATILPICEKNKLIETRISDFLLSISKTLSRTVEYYVPSQAYFVISKRNDCEGSSITVNAKVGFRRELDGEFEAVARIAHAFHNGGEKYNTKLWNYSDGKRRTISRSEYASSVAKARMDFSAYDLEFNTNGVRRSAVPLFEKGKFIGIIAVAENFFPQCDSHTKKNIKILRDLAYKF
jgi:DNA-binding IclR family transcriptional regulator